MTNLLLASGTFFALHRLVSGTWIRDVIVRWISEPWYRRAFALASLLCLAWLWLGWVEARTSSGNFDLFVSSSWLRSPQLFIQFVAVFLIVVGISTRNPTIAGMGEAVREPSAVHGAIRITRHPFLWGVSIFSAGHMMVEPDVASWIFFGTLLLLAFTGTISIDAKRSKVWGRDWSAFAEATSNMPFLAILQGRQRLRVGEIGWLRFVAACGVYALIAVFHRPIFGGELPIG